MGHWTREPEPHINRMTLSVRIPSPDSCFLMLIPLKAGVTNHDDGLELLALFLPVEHPDEEPPEPSLGNPLEVAVEQVVPVGEPK